jgi:hypothetical protein
MLQVLQNDVGVITLPNGRGHLAIAVLLRDSTLDDGQQEQLIADSRAGSFRRLQQIEIQ